MSKMVAFATATRGGGAARCRSIARLFAVAALAALAPAVSARADAPPSTLVLQLDGPAQFEFAGYFTALWKGYYKDAGLLVEIRPGSVPGEATVDPVREVAEGRAQFGVGTMRLAVQTAQGLPLLLLAPIFQASGAAVYYRADGDFASPGALVKAKIGMPPASDVLNLELATALRGDGIDPGKIQSVPLDPGQAVAALAERRVDAAIGSAWQVPWQARARKLAIKSFNPADYRVEFYGDTLFTLARFERANPAIVQQFRAATLKGWAYALDHSGEIAGRLASALPPPPGITDPDGFARYQAEIAHQLARYPEIPLGHSDAERWNRIEAALAGVGALVRTTGLDSFIYDPTAQARSLIDWRPGFVLAAIALAIIATGAALLWRRIRRPVPAPHSAVAATHKAAPLQPAAVSAEPASLLPLPATTDLNAILAALEPALRERVPAPVDFRLSLLPELWPCRTDRDAVAGLVGELVGAATGELRADDTLIVGTRNAAFDSRSVGDFPGARIGEFARITVRDSGPGLSDAAFECIFDPSATQRPAVAAASPAMGRLGGFARVESAEGIGTAVHLYFPRMAEAATAAEREAAPAARRYKASGSRPTQRRSRSHR